MNHCANHRHGFTLIELILAVAITVLLATCVYSATQAMSGTARRQGAISSKQTRRDRFEEIIRRDLRGWLPLKSSSGSATASTQPAPAPDDKQSLLKFVSTADALSSFQTAAFPTPQRATNIEYLLRKTDNTFEIDRIEVTRLKPAVQMVLYQSAEEPKVESFDGTKWLSQWTRNDRPAAIRWTLGADVIVIKL